MKKLPLVSIIVTVAVISSFVYMKGQMRKENKDITRMNGSYTSVAKEKTEASGNETVISNFSFADLKAELQEKQQPLTIADIANNLITPYCSMKSTMPNNVEEIVSLKSGVPDYLSEEEIQIRKEVFDAYNKLPKEIQYWCCIDKEYSSMTNAVLRDDEISKILELYKDDWENLITIADRLLYGNDTYRDVPAARRIFEYVWQNCPPDVHKDGDEEEYWKFTGLQYLAQSYVEFTSADDFEKNIELMDLLDREFTYDYEAGKTDYKNPYFWPGILQRAYSYSMLGNYRKVEEIYERFDEAFKNVDSDRSEIVKRFIAAKVKNGIEMMKYNQGRIDKGELINSLILSANTFDEIANAREINPYSKQKVTIDREQALNLIEYLRSQSD